MSTENSDSHEFTNRTARLRRHLTKSTTKATISSHSKEKEKKPEYSIFAPPPEYLGYIRWEYGNDDIRMMTWRGIAWNLDTRPSSDGESYLDDVAGVLLEYSRINGFTRSISTMEMLRSITVNGGLNPPLIIENGIDENAPGLLVWRWKNTIAAPSRQDWAEGENVLRTASLECR
ncbi:hypothetical protein ABFS82_01G041600 [Erythranthe guttata]|uniref:uncharacterized protein LOC105975253 n=1 Tax=Erythranthe guttata TaxID=4155 RepID=UPI00064D9137|nr:PREDICTED: uncharacterized protein LOC105975253 [Erythranthe guttata]|eukprot:XP_012855883.1 PREDICTED: uncharacterized protein LOC105975253 [Erythranthe guttata]